MPGLRALGGAIPRGIAAYGRLPLMHFRNCPVRAAEGCAKCRGSGELTDRKGIAFPVECHERRWSMLLNSVPLDIAGAMALTGETVPDTNVPTPEETEEEIPQGNTAQENGFTNQEAGLGN